MNAEALIRAILFALMLALAMPLAVRAADQDMGPAGADGISKTHFDPLDRRTSGPYDREDWNKRTDTMYAPEADTEKNARPGSRQERETSPFGEVEGDER